MSCFIFQFFVDCVDGSISCSKRLRTHVFALTTNTCGRRGTGKEVKLFSQCVSFLWALHSDLLTIIFEVVFWM